MNCVYAEPLLFKKILDMFPVDPAELIKIRICVCVVVG